jgi:WD40 repeat protein
MWDDATRPTASLPVGGTVRALAISADGKQVLTGNLEGDVTLWDSAGALLRRYDWGVKSPIAAAFAADGLRAAVGGADGQIVIWDLDD